MRMEVEEESPCAFEAILQEGSVKIPVILILVCCCALECECRFSRECQYVMLRHLKSLSVG